MQKPAIVPATLRPSDMRFYLPPTIQSDYTNLQYTDHPHFTETVGLIQDWAAYATRVGFAHVDESYISADPVYIRCTYFPVDWKSKVGNSDASANFKTDWHYIIRKGDIIVRESGELLMLTWDVKEHMNNQATQAQICNLKLTLTRKVNAVSDARGFVITPAHDEIILFEHPATFTVYSGRPDYMAAMSTPGINADSLMSGQVQFNSMTKRMTINDEFEYGGFTYRIIDLGWTETDYNQEHGLINFNCKRVAGGKYDPV